MNAKIFTWEFLEPLLKGGCGFGANDRRKVREDILRRLQSAVAHWGDAEWRATMTAPWVEIASFYEPLDAPLDTRLLAILAIRNSALETPHSAHQIPADSVMPVLMSGMISLLDREGWRGWVETPPERDPFAQLKVDYPTAWNAFHALGAGQEEYQDNDALAPPLAPGKDERIAGQMGNGSIMLDGVSELFDTAIVQAMHLAVSGKLGVMFFPTFKHMSRNQRKLFRVFDFFLWYGVDIVMINYAFSDGVIHRRKGLLRPAHNNSEMPGQITKHLGGVDQEHAVLLVEAAVKTGMIPYSETDPAASSR